MLTNNNGIKFRLLTRAHGIKSAWLMFSDGKNERSNALRMQAVTELKQAGLVEITYDRACWSLATAEKRRNFDGELDVMPEEGVEVALYRLTADGHKLCDELFSRFEGALQFMAEPPPDRDSFWTISTALLKKSESVNGGRTIHMGTATVRDSGAPSEVAHVRAAFLDLPAGDWEITATRVEKAKGSDA
jgi:hypothetical protein